MFRKQREFEFRWNVICIEEMSLEEVGSRFVTDCILLSSFVPLKTLERHQRFVVCEVIGSNIYSKKLISSNERILIDPSSE